MIIVMPLPTNEILFQVLNKDYEIFRHFKRADYLGDPNDITLVSQCSVDNLHHVPNLIKRWLGPTSIAVFVPGQG